MKKYPYYKKSDVKWIGHIPEHWEISKIKYQSEINREALSDKTDEDYELQYIDIGNVNSEGKISELQKYLFKDAPSRARRIVKKNDVLISTVRTYLKAITSIDDEMDDNVICSTGFAVLSPTDTIDPSYLAYLVRSDIYIDEIVSRSTGVSYPAINASQIGDLECILPPLNEQKKIGLFLKSKSQEIENLIQKQLKFVELLEQQRQLIITAAVTKGLNPNVKMKDSGIEWIGEIPEHWNRSKLKYLTKKIIDGTHHTPKYKDEGIPFLRVTDITQSKGKEINLENVKYISEEEHKELISRCKPEKGDLLVSKNGTIGIPKVVDWEWDFSIFVSLCLIKMDKSKLNPYFCSYFFESSLVDEQIAFGSKKSTIMNLHLDKVKEFFIFIPNLKEQEEIVKNLNLSTKKYDVLIKNVQNQIEKLKEYRQSLIYEAVTGKIDVRELELD